MKTTMFGASCFNVDVFGENIFLVSTIRILKKCALFWFQMDAALYILTVNAVKANFHLSLKSLRHHRLTLLLSARKTDI